MVVVCLFLVPQLCCYPEHLKASLGWEFPSNKENTLTIFNNTTSSLTSVAANPNDHCTLVFTPLCVPLPHWVGMICSISSILQKWCLWFPRLGHKRYYSFHLPLSWITCSGGSQLPYQEDTQAALSEVHVARTWCLLLTAMNAPYWKWIPQPQSGFQMAAALVMPWHQPHERLWTRMTQQSSSCILDPQKTWGNQSLVILSH